MLQLSFIGPPAEPAPAPPSYRLRPKVREAVRLSLAQHGIAGPVIDDVTDAVVREIASKPQSIDLRNLVLRMCGYRPTCWICEYPIDLDEPRDALASFTLDHVIPRSAGGGRLGLMNLKPAHRFCNIFRSVPRARRSTRARYDAFLADLATRASAST